MELLKLMMKIIQFIIKKYQWNLNLTIKISKISLIDRNLMNFILIKSSYIMGRNNYFQKMTEWKLKLKQN